MSKRKIQEIEPVNEELVSTPSSKRTRRVLEERDSTITTPTKSTKKPLPQAKSEEKTPRAGRTQDTPKAKRTGTSREYVTPKKFIDPDGRHIHIIQNADRSARRRSARNLIEQTIAGDSSDSEGLGGQLLAREIIQERASEVESEDEEQGKQVETPSRKGRSKPKISTKERSPTPTIDLTAHERYFFDNRSSAAKTSTNTLNSGDLISHSAYHEVVSKEEDSHASNIADLHEHHAVSFPLWAFELSQQFSLYLYGYGSKRTVLKDFAIYLHDRSPEQPPTTIMINGTHPDLTLKSLLTTIATAILPKQYTKLPAQAQHLSTMILSDVASNPPAAPIYLLISALSSKALTTSQALSILSQLSAHESIHLILTADNPNLPILFPTQLRAKFNFLFHDATTFLPYDSGTADSELSLVVDSVLELLGRKTSAAAGREGVRWVLKSLPENARGLYRIFVSEILSAAADGLAPAFDNQPERPLGENIDKGSKPSKNQSKREPASHGLPGIDAKILYQKALEEFLCSSEMMFWSLLKEFIDHRMIIVRKERGITGGGEMLGVEIGQEELEGVLEDLLE